MNTQAFNEWFDNWHQRTRDGHLTSAVYEAYLEGARIERERCINKLARVRMKQTGDYSYIDGWRDAYETCVEQIEGDK